MKTLLNSIRTVLEKIAEVRIEQNKHYTEHNLSLWD